MFLPFLKKFFGNVDERFVKKLQPIVDKINDLESYFEKLSNEELKSKTDEFKKRLSSGETLDDLLPEAFATVREASKRTLKQRHYDVQLVGGIILHRGMISEMKTGEGKTLVSTLPVYLNSLTEKGVHLVTVNDYLAKRDAQWMGEIYNFLGLTVGCIHNDLDDDERKKEYACDITYGTNNEFGFDYLRDNMKFEKEDLVMRGFSYAIVDEVDSILIDEARTPLIISGPTEDSTTLYTACDKLIPMLEEEHYEKDEKNKNVTFTESGNHKIEDLLREANLIEGGLYDVQNVTVVHHANQALRANKTFDIDVDYIIKDRKVMIIDEFTGRIMDGRRFSDGLHQALEAKENVPIERENQTLASITFQNYFRLYDKLAGMTGTGKTEEAEFVDIYKLEVIAIPTNEPVVRLDQNDEVYRSEREKYESIVKLVKDCQDRKQPVLVGTISIEKSESLASIFKKEGIKHNVLNARFHEQEAYIVSQAGTPGAVTIATNMAGRGTDIKLGGNLEMMLEHKLKNITNENERKKITDQLTEKTLREEQVVKEAGGLYIVGTERHESRRIDNQLRGRSGRQGDPGNSKFFLSLQDDLMRIFGSDRLDSMLQKLGLKDGEAITHPWVNKALERAQQKVEARNFDIRKHLLKYDDVMNDQRKVVYELRHELMDTEDAKDIVEGMRLDVIDDLVNKTIPQGSYHDQWEISTLHEEVQRIFGLSLPIAEWAEKEGVADIEIKNLIIKDIEKYFLEKEKKYGPELLRVAEKSLLLRILDTTWKDHLHALDHLREGINLRAYAQRDPLNEYKSEAFSMFEEMLGIMRENVTTVISQFTLGDGFTADDIRETTLGEADFDGYELQHPDNFFEEDDDEVSYHDEEFSAPLMKRSDQMKQEMKPEWKNVRRNDHCPCNSGRRFKHCHGKD